MKGDRNRQLSRQGHKLQQDHQLLFPLYMAPKSSFRLQVFCLKNKHFHIEQLDLLQGAARQRCEVRASRVQLAAKRDVPSLINKREGSTNQHHTLPHPQQLPSFHRIQFIYKSSLDHQILSGKVWNPAVIEEDYSDATGIQIMNIPSRCLPGSIRWKSDFIEMKQQTGNEHWLPNLH